MAASTAPPHHHMTRTQLVDVRVVGPRDWDHLEYYIFHQSYKSHLNDFID